MRPYDVPPNRSSLFAYITHGNHEGLTREVQRTESFTQTGCDVHYWHEKFIWDRRVASLVIKQHPVSRLKKTPTSYVGRERLAHAL